MYARKNYAKEKLMRGEKIMGVEMWLKDPRCVELMGFAGFDFVHIEHEHVGRNWDNVENIIRTAEIFDMSVVYRTEQCFGDEPPVNEIIKAIICGANMIMVPSVPNAEAAKKIVQAAKYPPLGKRGMSTCDRSFPEIWPRPGGTLNVKQAAKEVNEETMLWAIIETPEGVENIEEILDVEGIDVVGFGHQDYAIAMGIEDDNSELVNAAREKISEAAKRKGKLMWDYIDNDDQLEGVKRRQTPILIYGVDTVLMERRYFDMAAKFKKIK